ncbi:MAG: helix-turn-helix transcriptional regulator [Persicimonas sp.]
MTGVIRQQTGQLAVLALFAAIAALVAADLLIDYESGTSVGHVLLEGVVLGCAVIGVAVLGGRLLGAWRRARDESGQLRTELERTRADARRWKREAEQHLRGLGEAIEHQFERWGLTPAEKEVALLMLKGLSHADIAEVRGVSDRTVRQQAHVVYKKAGLDGRADLAAFFLEDLLLPRESNAQSAPD